MKASIIVLAHNQLEYTKKCLESIRKNTTNIEYEIIVVNNGSSDNTKEYLELQEDIIVINNEKNLGFSKGNNIGFEKAKGKYVVFLNNDTIVTKNWLFNMVNYLDENSTVGAVGPVTNNISGSQQISVNYNLENQSNLDTFVNNLLRVKKSSSTLRLVGFCLVVRKRILSEIGVFDEEFEVGNYEDDDLCLRILEYGYSLKIVHNSFVHHYGSITFKNEKINYENHMETNKIKFIEKWGFDPSYYMNARPEIARLVSKDSKKILDIGSGMGALSLFLKDRQECEVFGVEINSLVGKIAEPNLNNMIIGDIENLDISDLPKMDTIICGDVLEHLKNPWSVLIKLVELLNPHGEIIISIPNISNIYVIKQLLNGYFNYENAGILDRTHLRFFSRNNISSLLPTNMIINEVIPISWGYSEDDEIMTEYFDRILRKYNMSNNLLKTDLLTHQYVIHAKKIDNNL